MSLLSNPEPTPSRLPAIVAVLVVLVIGGGLAAWLLLRKASPPPPTTRPTGRATPTTRPSPTTRPEPGQTRPVIAVTPRPAPLRVESDIPGAQVFVDRQYLGATPLDVRKVAPGPHSLSVSIEGHDPHTEVIEIGEEPVRVNVRFREVRLEESLQVVHKHGMGSCRGALVANTSGLAYEATGGSHSFEASFETLERFEVDYLKKNLKVTLQGGRTYNFTIDGGNADPLLVFQKKVDAARKRLAAES